MKVYLAQVNPTIGDLKGNLIILKQEIQIAVNENCDVVVFPELVSTGYPPRDLLYLQEIWDNHEVFVQEIRSFIRNQNQQITVIFGGLHQVQETYGRFSRYNAAYIIDQNSTQIVHKRLLPCYDVFDETRYFKSGSDEPYLPVPIKLEDGKTINCDVIICEDMWNFKFKGKHSWMSPASYTIDPVSNLKGDGPIFIINGSPYWQGKIESTKTILHDICESLSRPVIWVNQIGAHDDIVTGGYNTFVQSTRYVQGNNFCGSVEISASPFSEKPLIINSNELIRHQEEFAERLIAFNQKTVHDSDLNNWYNFSALKLALRDYCRRTGFTKVVFGASGGIDSALVGAIAAETLGGQNVTAITMPSPYSSQSSWEDAEQLAINYGMKFINWDISDLYKKARSKMLTGGRESFKHQVTDENIQPRLRAMLLMMYANDENALLLSTGNKSELSVGYCTLGGDTMGGYSLLGDVSKTMVYKLADFINRYTNKIPPNCLTKEPSAELASGQKDTDSLPKYSVLDSVLEKLVDQECSLFDVIKEHRNKEEVLRINKLIVNAEYKRSQLPICPKITHRAYGSGRRIPIAKNVRLI